MYSPEETGHVAAQFKRPMTEYLTSSLEHDLQSFKGREKRS